jgi:hypothetical protein
MLKGIICAGITRYVISVQKLSTVVVERSPLKHSIVKSLYMKDKNNWLAIRCFFCHFVCLFAKNENMHWWPALVGSDLSGSLLKTDNFLVYPIIYRYIFVLCK